LKGSQYVSCPLHSRQRNGSATIEPGCHRQQPRQLEHHRLPAAPGKFRRPSVFKRHHARRRRDTVGTGARPSETEIIQTQGEFSTTGNPLDIAISGLGFFQILLPSGQIGYTRDGSFHPDAQGQLVTADGNPLQPAVTIPEDALSVTIGADGTVSVSQPNQTQSTQVGVIQTALFINPGGLNAVGDNIYLQTTASGQPVVGTPAGAEGLGSIQQGMLEQSNVSVVNQFVAMILAQRAYESNSRVVKAADEMLQQLSQLAT
jgi:flagellar basal-body rod protein FlgG